MNALFWLDVLSGVFALFVAWVLWACGGFPRPAWKKLKFVPLVETSPTTDVPAKRLRILTWNLGYAYGLGSDGSSYQPKTRTHYFQTLEKMAEVLKKVDADIVFLQEVDFNSDRSHRMHQSEFLAKEAGYTYRADAVSWFAHWVPFPYWPLRRHFGKMVSGSSILSKAKPQAHRVFFFPKPKQQFFIYRWFYPFRYTQWVSWVGANQQPIWVVNIHLEAFSKVVRELQAKIVAQLLRAPPEKGRVLILAGDWNAIPQAADTKLKDRTFEFIQGAKVLIPALPKSKLFENEQMTFPSDSPDRKLDHVWVGEGVRVVRHEVLKLGALSDHLPIVVEIEWN